MKKQELIKHIEDLPYNEGLIVDTIKISRKGLLELVKQLDEPEKVKVPWFVAEYIKWAKKEDFHLLGAMNRENFDKKLDDWFYTDDNIEVFARAWLDGYEVGEEKRYLVKVIGMSKFYEYLNFDTTENRWKFFDCDNTDTYRTHHTRKELEDGGFGWVFDCPGIWITEVKDE